MPNTRELPMFPLGLTLVPGAVLPLYLFEERYLRLYEDVVSSDREFGVVLIERGIESRDDNPTFSIGCVAQLLGSGRHENGSMSVVALGTERFRVVEWLESDPYPRALVEMLPSEPPTEIGLVRLATAKDRLPQLMALAAELDASLSVEIPEFSEDPSIALFQVAQMSGPQSLDMQQILEAETSDDRAEMVENLIQDQIELLELQLSAD